MVPITAEVIRLVEELDNFMEEILQRIEEYLWNEEWFRGPEYNLWKALGERIEGETRDEYLERVIENI